MAKRTVKISVSDDVYRLLEHIGIEDTQELPEEIMAQIIEEYHIEFLRERGIQVIDGRGSETDLGNLSLEQLRELGNKVVDLQSARIKGRKES